MIKTFILRLLANAAALYFVVYLLQPAFQITGLVKGFLITALIFGVLNSFVKPVLKLLTLPLILVTAGLFALVINMFVVWFAQYALDILAFEGVAIIITGGFLTYLYVGFLMSIANVIINWLTK